MLLMTEAVPFLSYKAVEFITLLVRTAVHRDKDGKNSSRRRAMACSSTNGRGTA
jgi:hypothetical protein